MNGTIDQLKIRLPHQLKLWLRAQAVRNGSSQNSEIIRAVRERMERESIARATDGLCDTLHSGEMGD